MIQLAALTANLTEAAETPLSLTAIIDSALCVGAGGSAGSLADKPIVRTASGDLLIPASQLKGRLRHECEKLLRGLGWPICHSPNPQNMCPERADAGERAAEFLAQGGYALELGDRLLPMPTSEGDSSPPAPETPHYHCYICQIFGNPAIPSNLQFDDLVCTTRGEDLAEVLRPGVTLNRRRRTAEDQKFFLLETSPPQTQLAFTGEIHILPTAPAFTQTLLTLALKHVHALGGSKSAGLGWLHWQHNLQAEPEALKALVLSSNS